MPTRGRRPRTRRIRTTTGADTTRVRIDLAYDGSGFSGFARQPDRTTVQGDLEDALARVLGLPPDTTCAGRTDAGVHALAQVVHLDVDASVPRAGRWLELLAERPDTVRRRLDRLLGPAVVVLRVVAVPDDFHARFSAVQRTYRYRMVDAAVADPRLRNVRWTVGEPLAIEPMQQGAALLVGDHDFAAFCRRAPGRHTHRRVDEAGVVREADEVHVWLRGPAFCHQQVRSIVGCLVEVGRSRRPPDWIGAVLAARDRSLAAPVAPPQGLTLEAVSYGQDGDAAPPRPPAPR